VAGTDRLEGSRTIFNSDQESFIMLLVVAIILLLLFGGLGFIAHILWFGLILAVIILVAHMLTGSRA
jgi:hypothetical protein